MAAARSSRITTATTTAAHPESRNTGSAGSGRGTRLVRMVGTSPGCRCVLGAARVSAAVARQVAQVRVEPGLAGLIGAREGTQ